MYSSHCERLFTWQFPLIFVSLWEVVHLTVPLNIRLTVRGCSPDSSPHIRLTVRGCSPDSSPSYVFSKSNVWSRLHHDISALTFSIIAHKMNIEHVIPSYGVILNMPYPAIMLLWTCHTLLSCYFPNHQSFIFL